MEDTCKRKLNRIREAYVPLLEKYLKERNEETPIRKKLIILYKLLTSKNQNLGIPTLIRSESILIKIFGKKVKASSSSMANIVSKITDKKEIKVNENNNQSVNKVPSDDLTQSESTKSDLSDKVICQINDISSTQEEDNSLSSDVLVDKSGLIDDDSTEVIKDMFLSNEANEETDKVPANTKEVEENPSKDNKSRFAEQILKQTFPNSLKKPSQEKELLMNEKPVDPGLEEIETSNEDLEDKNASFSEREMQILTSLLDDVDSSSNLKIIELLPVIQNAKKPVESEIKSTTESTNAITNDPDLLNSQVSLSDDNSDPDSEDLVNVFVLVEEKEEDTSSEEVVDLTEESENVPPPTKSVNMILTDLVEDTKPTVESDIDPNLEKSVTDQETEDLLSLSGDSSDPVPNVEETTESSPVTQTEEIVDPVKVINDEVINAIQSTASKLGRIKLKLSPNKTNELTDSENLECVVEEDLDMSMEEVVDLTEESELVQSKSSKNPHFGIIDLTELIIESDKTESVPDLEKSEASETEGENVAESVMGIIDLTNPAEVMEPIDLPGLEPDKTESVPDLEKSAEVSETKGSESAELTDSVQVIKPTELSGTESEQISVPVPETHEENVTETIEQPISRPMIKCIPTELLKTSFEVSPLRESRFFENTNSMNSRVYEDVNSKSKRTNNLDIENIPEQRVITPSTALLKNVIAQLPSVQSLMTKPVPTEKDTVIESDILSSVNELINGTDESHIGPLSVLLPEISNLVSSQEDDNAWNDGESIIGLPSSSPGKPNQCNTPSGGNTHREPQAIQPKPEVLKMPRIKVTKSKNDKVYSNTHSNNTQNLQTHAGTSVTNQDSTSINPRIEVLPDATRQIPVATNYHKNHTPKITSPHKQMVVPAANSASSTYTMPQNQVSSVVSVLSNRTKNYHVNNTQPMVTNPHIVMPAYAQSVSNSMTYENAFQSHVQNQVQLASTYRMNQTQVSNSMTERVVPALQLTVTQNEFQTPTNFPVNQIYETQTTITQVQTIIAGAAPINRPEVINPDQNLYLLASYDGGRVHKLHNVAMNPYTPNTSNNMIADATALVQSTSYNSNIPVVTSIAVMPKETSTTQISSEQNKGSNSNYNNIPGVTSLPVLPDGMSALKSPQTSISKPVDLNSKSQRKEMINKEKVVPKSTRAKAPKITPSPIYSTVFLNNLIQENSTVEPKLVQNLSKATDISKNSPGIKKSNKKVLPALPTHIQAEIPDPSNTAIPVEQSMKSPSTEKLLPAAKSSPILQRSMSLTSPKVTENNSIKKVLPATKLSPYLPSMPLIAFVPATSSDKLLPAVKSTPIVKEPAVPAVKPQVMVTIPKLNIIEKVVPAMKSPILQRVMSPSATPTTPTSAAINSTPKMKHIEKNLPASTQNEQLLAVVKSTPIQNNQNESTTPKVKQIENKLPTSTQKEKVWPTVKSTPILNNHKEPTTPKVKHIEKLLPASTQNKQVLPAMKSTPIQKIHKEPIVPSIKTSVKLKIDEVLPAVKSSLQRSMPLIDDFSAPSPPQKENHVDPPQSHLLTEEENFYGPLRPWISLKNTKAEMSARKMFQNKNTFKSLYKCMEVNCAVITDDCSKFLTHIKAHERAGEEYIMNGGQPSDQVSWLSCSYCEYVADSCNMLLLHIDKVHSTSIFQCNNCFYRSTTAYNVHTHYSLHHPGIEASINVASSSQLLLKDEINDMLKFRKIFVREIECKDDGCKFFVIEDFVTHLEEKHTVYNCHLCPVSLPIKMATRHLLCHNIGIFNCIFCEFGKNSDQMMRNHMSNKHSSRLLFACARYLRKDVEADSSKVESTVIVNLGDIVATNLTTYENSPDANILYLSQLKDLYFQSDKHVETPEITVFKTELPPLIIDDSQFEAPEEPEESDVPEEPEVQSDVPDVVEEKVGNLIIEEVESLSNLKTSPIKEQVESPQIDLVSNETADELLVILKSRSSKKVDKKRKITPEPEPKMAKKRTRKSVSTEEKQIDEKSKKTSKTSKETKVDERRTRKTIVEEPTKTRESSKKTTIDQSHIIDERRTRKPVTPVVEEPKKKSRRTTIDEIPIIKEKPKPVDRQDEIDSFIIEQVKKSGLEKCDLYRCSTCSVFSANTSYEFQLHLLKCRSDKNKPNKCFHCTSESRTVLDLIAHLNYHAVRRFICYFCDEKTVTLEQMLIHAGKHSKNVKEFPINPKKTDKKCDVFVIAPRKSKSEDIYNYGVRLLDRNSKISVKSVFQPDEVNELPKTLWFSSECSCGVCGFSTKIRADLVSHLQKHLTTKADGKKIKSGKIQSIEAVQSTSPVLNTRKQSPRKQPVQNNKTPQKEPVQKNKTQQIEPVQDNRKEPIQDSKKLRNFPDTPKYIPDEKRFSCGAKGCSYNTRAASLFKTHLSKHKGLYNCPHCKKEQTSDEMFLRHLELHGCVLYKCLNCKFYSASKSQLLLHTEDKHNIGEDGRLTIREAFSTNLITKPTSAQVVPVKPTASVSTSALTPTPPQIVYNCNHCMQYYSTIEELKKHWNNLHKSPKFKPGLPFQFKVTKIISCYYCNRKGAFTEIQKHSRNDHGLKPFLTVNSKQTTKCSECNYTITDKAQFTDHFEANHSSIKYLNQSLLDRMLTVNNTKKYKCEYCELVIDAKQEMKQHCIDRHPNENVMARKCKDQMRYSCPHMVDGKRCKLLFDDELDAIKHIRSHSLYYGCNMKSCDKRFTSQRMTEDHHKINHHKTGIVYPAASVNRVLDYVCEMTVIFPNGLCCTKAELCNTVYGTVDEIKERLNDLNEWDKQEVVDKRVAAKLDKKMNSQGEKRRSGRNQEVTESSSDDEDEVLSTLVASTTSKKRKRLSSSSSSSSDEDDDDFIPAPKKLRKRIRVVEESSDEEDETTTKFEGEYSFYGLDKETVDYSKIYTVMNVGGNFIRMPCDKFGMIFDIQPSLSIEKLKK